MSDSYDNDDSERQLVVKRNNPSIFESEDEHGFPISMHLRKRNPVKGPEGNSKSDDMAVDEDKKQKINVISQDGETTRLQGKSQMPPQIYAVSITSHIVLGFMVIALIWKFDFSPFMVLIIAILNDGTIMEISKDRVKPFPTPDSWKLMEILAIGVVYGSYLALMTIIFFWVMRDTDFFSVNNIGTVGNLGGFETWPSAICAA